MSVAATLSPAVCGQAGVEEELVEVLELDSVDVEESVLDEELDSLVEEAPSDDAVVDEAVRDDEPRLSVL